MAGVPEALNRVFYNVDLHALDTEQHADGIIPRVLEHGDVAAIRWLVRTYGRGRIHAFLRDTGSPILSDRTLSFWRAALRVGDESWNDPRSWRRDCGPAWPS